MAYVQETIKNLGNLNYEKMGWGCEYVKMFMGEVNKGGPSMDREKLTDDVEKFMK